MQSSRPSLAQLSSPGPVLRASGCLHGGPAWREQMRAEPSPGPDSGVGLWEQLCSLPSFPASPEKHAGCWRCVAPCQGGCHLGAAGERAGEGRLSQETEATSTFFPCTVRSGRAGPSWGKDCHRTRAVLVACVWVLGSLAASQPRPGFSQSPKPFGSYVL